MLTSQPIALESLMNGIQQILGSKWFGQELHGTRLHGFNTHRNVPMTRNKDYRDLHSGLGQLTLQIQTAGSRKPYVQNKAAWTMLPLVVQKLLRRSEGFRVQAYCLQHSLNG